MPKVSKYNASSIKGGLGFPDYRHIARSFGLKYYKISNTQDFSILKKIYGNRNTLNLVDVNIPSEARVVPQVKFGRPNEDMEPLLPRSLFKNYMIVKTI